MKIVLINSVCGIGSTGKIVADLYEGYKEAGHDVKVICGRQPIKRVPEKDVLCCQSKAGLCWHIGMTRLFDRHGLTGKLSTDRMIRFLRDFDPDVVHLHNIHGYYLDYRRLFAYLNNTQIKVVWTLHDAWAFTGHCAYYNGNGCYKWETRCEKCKFIRAYPKSWLIDHSKKQFELKKRWFCGKKELTLVTPSEWLKEEAGRSFLREKRTVVINNSVDTEIFKPTPSDVLKKYGIDPNKKIVLGVSYVWGTSKGLDYFLQLPSALGKEYQIVMVGLSEKQLESLPEGIVGIVRTFDQKELAQLYSAASVFFNPTLCDNYPTVNIESLCCGTPVVCFSKTGGGPEIVGENGIVLDKRDLESVCEAIRKGCTSTVDVAAVHEKYKKSRYVKDYLSLLQHLTAD